MLALASVFARDQRRRAGANPRPPDPDDSLSIRRIEGHGDARQLQKTHGADGMRSDPCVSTGSISPHVQQGVGADRAVSPVRRQPRLSPFPATVPADAAGRRGCSSSRGASRPSRRTRSGALVRWGPTSTGPRETPTPAGLFATNWKSKLRRSSDNREWLLPWYVNFINATGRLVPPVCAARLSRPATRASACSTRTRSGSTTGPRAGCSTATGGSRDPRHAGDRVRRVRLRQARSVDASG